MTLREITLLCALGVFAIWCIFLTVKVHQFNRGMCTFGSGIREKFVSVDDTLDELKRHSRESHRRLLALEQPAYRDDHAEVHSVWDAGTGRMLGVFKSRSSAEAVRMSFSEDDRKDVTIHSAELAE